MMDLERPIVDKTRFVPIVRSVPDLKGIQLFWDGVFLWGGPRAGFTQPGSPALQRPGGGPARYPPIGICCSRARF